MPMFPDPDESVLNHFPAVLFTEQKPGNNPGYKKLVPFHPLSESNLISFPDQRNQFLRLYEKYFQRDLRNQRENFFVNYTPNLTEFPP